MIYTIVFFAIVILTLTYMVIETTLLQKSSIILSKSSKGLKIAHLSDLHVNHLHLSSKKIINNLKQINPDIIIITGDYIESEKDIPKALDLIASMSKLFPVYLSLGNHDHKALYHNQKHTGDFIRKIQKTGATVLNNANTNIVKNNTVYNLIGIDDLKHGRPDILKAFSDIKQSNEKYVNIAFSHNPDMVLNLSQGNVDYFLCGHFHGGQIWMPFHLEFRILRREKLCKMGYRRGLHKVNGIVVYINRGIGNVLFPLRFLSIPEIAVIQLP